MKPRIIKRTLSLITVLALIFTLAVQGAGAIQSADVNKYPYVYVHGLFGWGADEGIDGTLPYWGAASCSLMDELNKLHYESYAASVGPMSSNWDRVCELYAQITGTRVDYGKAHSEKFNHSRYGRTYTKPMIEGWGEPDADGNIKKINLVGHSFGGATVRTLTALLAYGSGAGGNLARRYLPAVHRRQGQLHKLRHNALRPAQRHDACIYHRRHEHGRTGQSGMLRLRRLNGSLEAQRLC